MELSQKQIESLKKQEQICNVLAQGPKSYAELRDILKWDKSRIHYPLTHLAIKGYVIICKKSMVYKYSLSTHKVFDLQAILTKAEEDKYVRERSRHEKLRAEREALDGGEVPYEEVKPFNKYAKVYYNGKRPASDYAYQNTCKKSGRSFSGVQSSFNPSNGSW